MRTKRSPVAFRRCVIGMARPSCSACPPNNVGNGRTEEDVANSNGAKLLGCTVKDCPDLAKLASGLDQVSSDDAPHSHYARRPGSGSASFAEHAFLRKTKGARCTCRAGDHFRGRSWRTLVCYKGGSGSGPRVFRSVSEVARMTRFQEVWPSSHNYCLVFPRSFFGILLV